MSLAVHTSSVPWERARSSSVGAHVLMMPCARPRCSRCLERMGRKACLARACMPYVEPGFGQWLLWSCAAPSLLDSVAVALRAVLLFGSWQLSQCRLELVPACQANGPSPLQRGSWCRFLRGGSCHKAQLQGFLYSLPPFQSGSGALLCGLSSSSPREATEGQGAPHCAALSSACGDSRQAAPDGTHTSAFTLHFPSLCPQTIIGTNLTEGWGAAAVCLCCR